MVIRSHRCRIHIRFVSYPKDVTVVLIKPTYIMEKDANKTAKDVAQRIESRIVNAVRRGWHIDDVPTEPSMTNTDTPGGGLIACDGCLKEIPRSAAQSEEGEDYVYHFCGAECHDQWRTAAGMTEIGLTSSTPSITDGCAQRI